MKRNDAVSNGELKMFWLLLAAVVCFGFFSVFCPSSAQDQNEGSVFLQIKNAIGYGSTDFDILHSIFSTSDNGFVATGFYIGTITLNKQGENIILNGKGERDFLLLKMDKDFNITHVTSFGGTGNDVGFSIIELSNGGYAVTGYFSNTVQVGKQTLKSNGLYDVFVVKLDEDLNIINAVSFGSTDHEIGFSIIESSEGGFFATGCLSDTMKVGNKTLTSNGGYDVFVVKLDEDFNITNAVSFGGTGSDAAYSIVEDSDGGCVVAGDFNNSMQVGNKTLTSNGGADVFIVKLDKNLDISDAVSFGGTGSDGFFYYGNPLIRTSDGRYAITGGFQNSIQVGNQTLTSNGTKNTFVVILDENLNFTNAVNFGGTGANEGRTIVESVDGGYAVTGNFQNSIQVGNQILTSNGSTDIFVAKLDENLNFTNAVSFGGTGSDDGYDITFSSTGDYAVVGDFSNKMQLGNIILTSKGSKDGLAVLLGGSSYEVNFTKVSREHPNMTLPDAKFVMRNEEGLYLLSSGFTFGSRENAKVFTSDENGEFSIVFNRTGIYYLEEIQSPESYRNNPYVYIVEVTESAVKVIETEAIEYSQTENTFDGRLLTSDMIQDDEHMKDPEQTNYTQNSQSYLLTDLLDADHIVHTDMTNTPVKGEYTIEKEAEWEDIEKGKAKITLTVTRPPLYEDKREKETIAVYAFTPCIAHAFSKELAIKNITQLLESYDYIDIVVVTDPKLDPDGDGEVNMDIWEKRTDGVPDHDGTWVLASDSCAGSDNCVPGVIFWKEVNKNDVDWLTSQITFRVQQHYANAIPAALTAYFAEREKTNNLPGVVYVSMDRVNLYSGPTLAPGEGWRISDALNFAFDYSADTWKKLQAYASTEVTEDNPKGVSHYYVLSGSYSFQEEDIRFWHVLASLLDPSQYDDPKWETITVKQAREDVEKMSFLPYEMDFRTLNIDLNPDFNKETVMSSVLADTLPEDLRINHVETIVTDKTGQEVDVSIPCQIGTRNIMIDLADIDVSNTVKITIYADTATKGKIGNLEWFDTNAKDATLTETRRYNYDILDPVKLSTESPVLAQIAITYTGQEVEKDGDAFLIPDDPADPHSFTIKKVDQSTGDALAGAVFSLSGTTDDGKDITDESARLFYAGLFRGSDTDLTHNYEPTIEVTTDANGLAVFENIPEGSYYLTETKAPAGYDAAYNALEVIITPEDVPDDVTVYGLRQDSVNKYWIAENPESKNITIKKVDTDTGAALSGAVFEVSYYDTQEKQIVTEEKTTDEDGLIVLDPDTYTIKEIQAPDGYVINPDVWYVSSDDDNRIITVQNSKQTGTITVTKKWEDGMEYVGAMARPHPHIVLWGYDGNDVKYQNSTTNDESKWVKLEEEPWDTWTYTFEISDTGLTYKAWEEGSMDTYVNAYGDGNPISVTIDGENVITNGVETIDISGQKTWVDNDNYANKRPVKLIISVYGEDKSTPIDTKEVTAADEWKWEFTGLPKYYAGKEIKYSITEDTIDEYEHEHDGYNITNTYTPGKIELSVSKTWDDDHNRDGARPTDPITVKLYRDDQTDPVAIGTISEPDWNTIHFKDLDEWDTTVEPWVKYEYSVKEDPVPTGYKAEITETGSGYNIKNSYTPKTTSLSGTKVWNDNNDQDGMRPDEVTIYLWASGDGYNEVVKHTTAKASEGWTWKFEDLYVNKDGKAITYTVSEKGEEDDPETDAIDGYTSVVNGTTITNSHTPETTDFEVYKEWDDENNQDGKRPDSVTVELLSGGSGTGKTAKLNEDNEWHAEFKNLPVYSGGKKIEYSVKETEDIDGYESESVIRDGNLVLINIHEPETIDIFNTKIWIDEDNYFKTRPTSVTIHLLENGDEIARTTATAANNWYWEFKDLPVYSGGTALTYTVTEDEVDGYETEIDGFTITNTLIPETRDITVTKTWNDADDQDGIRPEDVTVILLADGTEADRALLDKTNEWSHTFEGLKRYNGTKEIAYTVKEIEVKGYETKINGFNVTNTHIPEVIEITGSKTWDDENDAAGARPQSLTIRLHAAGEVAASQTVTAANGWSWEFKDLPKYEAGEEGKEIVYSVSEDALSDYSTEYDGYNIINRYTPGKTSLTVSKDWVDEDDQDGCRPDSVTVLLYADYQDGNGSQDTGLNVELNEDNHWEASFRELDQAVDGKTVLYTVQEAETDVLTGTDGPGTYTIEVSGNATQGFIIRNTHTPETIDVFGTKTWEDEEGNLSFDGSGQPLPDSITVLLHENGVIVDSVDVTEDENGEWKGGFYNLPKYKNGEEIIYTISEDRVTDYTPELDGLNIINHYTPGMTYLNVSKVWADRDDVDGIRPDSVTVTLLANGEETDQTAVLKEENDWFYEFTGLLAENNEGLIEYTVRETLTDVITGEDTASTYAVDVECDQDEGCIVTNLHTPLFVEIPVTKVWEGGSADTRPDSIGVTLYRNGEEVETLELSAANDWQGLFTDRSEDMEDAIEYSIAEIEEIDGYTTTITGNAEDGFVITNSRITVPPTLYRLDVLPETGITGAGLASVEMPMAVGNTGYAMSLQIPTLEIITDIVSVMPENDRYPVSGLGWNAGLLADGPKPGEGHAFIAGHNTLNAEDLGPFARLAEMQSGDRFFIEDGDGQLRIYEVVENQKVAANDAATLIQTASGYETTVTLLTCEDERAEGGYASRRAVTAREIR